ncbi:Twitching mobility protein [Marinobacter litoralis]|uniref:Twitching mobility protein n=2 Tax=Marinobacter litoralis TaxID=187981 RepID=A0A3M2RLI7_9GAMM|nr:Twitching mobility protein [Marinobacter litoralis]
MFGKKKPIDRTPLAPGVIKDIAWSIMDEEQRVEFEQELEMNLAMNLRVFVSQRLIPTVDKKRCAAIEILLGTPTISDLILRGEFENIKAAMEKSANLGMQTFDLALLNLWKDGKITEEEALKNADSANNLRLKIKLNGQDGSTADGQGNKPSTPSGSGLSLMIEDDEDNPEP